MPKQEAMVKSNFRIGVVLLSIAMLVACEKPYVGLEEEQAETTANVFVNVNGFEQIPFDDTVVSRAEGAVDDLCTRLNFVIYQGDTKVQSIPQKKGDDKFGHIAITLPEGSYKIAVIGHSSVASATVTSLDKISFEKNLLTDTFYYYQDFQVGAGSQTLDVIMKRVVAMFRLQLTADLPENITQLKFYYTGGSSTLSALTGLGSVNSKQTVTMDVTAGQRLFEVYTIPHTVQDELKMTISAMDASGTVIKERIFESVPVKQNMITRYTGDFFKGSSSEISETSLQVRVASEWEGENDFTF